MKPTMSKGTSVSFKFLRSLADHLETLKPPYTYVQKITINKIHVASGGQIRDFDAVVKGTREGQPRTGARGIAAVSLEAGGEKFRHLDDCTWESAEN